MVARELLHQAALRREEARDRVEVVQLDVDVDAGLVHLQPRHLPVDVPVAAARAEAALGGGRLERQLVVAAPVAQAVGAEQRAAGDLALQLSVNGALRQDSGTAKMIFLTAEQIAALSRITPLLPGDLVLTGTPPGTAAAQGTYLADGDVMTAGNRVSACWRTR